MTGAVPPDDKNAPADGELEPKDSAPEPEDSATHDATSTGSVSWSSMNWLWFDAGMFLLPECTIVNAKKAPASVPGPSRVFQGREGTAGPRPPSSCRSVP